MSKNKEPKEEPKTEPEKEPAALWIYEGKHPTRAAGRLVYPGNVVAALSKPGPAWKRYKPKKGSK